MKNKIFGIVLFVIVIFSLIIINTYAYIDSDIIENNKEYYYNSNNSYVFNINNDSKAVRMIYNGECYNNNGEIINISDFSFDTVNIENEEIYKISIYDHNNVNIKYYIYYYGYENINGSIKLNRGYTIRTEPLDLYFKETLTPKYTNTNNLLVYAINTINIIINYCITNTIILVVISIFIISITVGIIIRINRKKF